MTKRLLYLAFFLIFTAVELRAQCVISGPRIVCENDIAGFTIKTSSGTITGYSWNFGIHGTSSNANPSIKFSPAGTVLASCTLTLAGGGQCIDTHRFVVVPNPVSKVTLDVSSDTCQRLSNVCLKNLAIKGATGFKAINIVWGDGFLMNYSPADKKWCYHFGDTGYFKNTVEVVDSFGCHNLTNYWVHVVQSVTTKVTTSVQFKCDSSGICYTGSATGGKTLTYKWFHLPNTSTVVTTNKGWCKWTTHGSRLNAMFVATNEYGCTDTTIMKEQAPDSFLSFSVGGGRYCPQSLAENPISISAKYKVQWYLNNKNFGFSDNVSIGTGKPGWNYIKMVSTKPCPFSGVDSFWLSIVRAHSMAFNSVQRGTVDTMWFMDISKNAKGSKISILWNFNDTSACQDTIDTKHNKNVGRNCNYSKDSIAWHVYKNKNCQQVQLTVFDSTTGCTADTFIDVFGKEFCTPFALKKTACLGDPMSFEVNYGAYRRFRDSHWIIPDTKRPKDTFRVDGPGGEFFYRTIGKKTVIFARKYPPDTLWTERNGKMVIATIRPSTGWIIDTFPDLVEMLYVPNPEFSITKLSTCKPSKVRIDFTDSFWLYPKQFKIIWGDSVDRVDSVFTDTIFHLTSLEHTYPKPGIYSIVVQMTPKNGCLKNHVETVFLGYDRFFRAKNACNNPTICIIDSVKEKGTLNKWTKWNNYGKLYWDWGDGTKDSGFNPCHTYAYTPGNSKFKVIMTSKSTGGCIDTLSHVYAFGDAEAGIKKIPVVFCSEVHKYFDSSQIFGTADSAKIIGYKWDFGDGSKPAVIKDPVHFYSNGGTYTLKLVITTNRGCHDTAIRIVNVLGPELTARIISDSVGCMPLHVRFATTSKNTSHYIWKFGDSNNTFLSTDKDSNTSFTYKKPGTYYVHLTGSDSFYNPVTGNKYFCSITVPDSAGNQLRIVVTSGGHSELVGPDTLCVGDEALFLNRSDSALGGKYEWDMGDGSRFIRPWMNMKYKYQDSGTFLVTLHSRGGVVTTCLDTASKYVTVYNFKLDFSAECGSSEPPYTKITNLSGQGVQDFKWTLLNPADSSEKLMGYGPNMKYNFGTDTGTFTVCLRLDKGKFCKDKICKPVHLSGGVYMANVFTPGSIDGFNDKFRIPMYGFSDFEFVVFNRWGEKVFESNSPYNEWNGKVMNTGLDLPAGTYFYQLQYRDECGKKDLHKVHGSITMIR